MRREKLPTGMARPGRAARHMTTAQRIAALQPLIDAGTATDAQRQEYAAEQAIQAYARSKKPPKPERPPKPVKVRKKRPVGFDRKKWAADYRCEHRAELYADNQRYYIEHREEIRKYQEERRRRLKGAEQT